MYVRSYIMKWIVSLTYFLDRDLPSCELPEFKFTSAEDLDGTLIKAELDQYNGGGYVFRIKGANKDLRWDVVIMLVMIMNTFLTTISMYVLILDLT